MAKKVRKYIILAFCLLLCIGVGWRIYYVNANAFQETYEYYKMNEWVDYDNSFQNTIDEHTAGYSARVVSAEMMTIDEYAQKYNIPIKDIDKSTVADNVLDLEMEYKNVSSQDGYIYFTEATIFAPNDNTCYAPSQNLIELLNLDVIGEYGLGFKLRPNGEAITLHLPYTLPVNANGYKGKETGIYPKYLALTRTPIKKLIEIDMK